MDELRPVVEALEETSWSAVVTDAAWRIVWSSSELGLILGGEAASDLGVGRHMLETGALRAFSVLNDAGVEEWVRSLPPDVDPRRPPTEAGT